MAPAAAHAPPALVPAPGAPLGAGDPTRRWALAFAGGAVRFPGITRTEADRVAAALGAAAPERRDRMLVEVALPVLLSEGAGPHLLDASGALVLGLAAHPALAPARVAMGSAPGGERIGLAAALGAGLWEWRVSAVVPGPRRVAALDALDAAAGDADALAWQGRWRGIQ